MSATPTPIPTPPTDFFTANNGLWSFSATLATVVMVVLTYFTLRENIKARKAQFRPNIIVNFVIEDFFTLELIVKNTGNSPALNVKIDIDPQVGHPFNDIKFLAPNSEMRHPIMFIEHTSHINVDYNFSISYFDVFKKHHADNYPVNIKPLLDSYEYNKTNTLKQIADGLNHLANSIETKNK